MFPHSRVLLICSIAALLLFSCMAVPQQEQTGPSFTAVIESIRTLEKNGRFDAAEQKVRTHLDEKWMDHQKDELRYHLAWVLYKKGKPTRALTVLNNLRENKQLLVKTNALGASASFDVKRYERALDYALTLYPYLKDPADKISFSRIIFVSYLHTGDMQKAATWYAAVDDDKKQAVSGDINAFFTDDPDGRKAFFALVKTAKKYAPVPVKKHPDTIDGIEAPAGETKKETSPPAEKPEIDASYEPDWNSLCVMLSADRRWVKYNDVVKKFMPWYIKAMTDNENLIVHFIEYLTREDVTAGFKKARKKKCFAVSGPLFTEELAHTFYTASLAHSIPVITYSPWESGQGGLFFNIKYTLDREATDIISHLSDEDKKKYAILYSGTRAGRHQRDVYWNTIESGGGTVVDAIEFSPGEHSFLCYLDSIVSMPPNYEQTIEQYKKSHAAKHRNRTLLERAVERFRKLAPGQVEADVFIVLLDAEEAAMLIPAFAYKNVGLEYYSPYLKGRQKAYQRSLKKKQLNWKIDTVMFVPHYRVKYNERFIDRVGKHIEGMIISAPVSPTGEDQPEPLKKLEAAAKTTFKRELYPPERIIAELLLILLEAREKKADTTMTAFYKTLHSATFTSLLTGRDVSFNERNRLTGNTAISRGVKDRGFVPLSTLAREKEENKKKEEKKNSKKKGEKSSDGDDA